MTESDRSRFLAKVSVGENDLCWEWEASVKPNGYGQFTIGGRAAKRTLYAHRVSYEIYKGRIPNGLQIDHLCRNRRCVNPRHLEAVEPRENTRRSFLGQKPRTLRTHCKHGHEFTAENTSLRSDGERRCRTCNQRRCREYYRRRRGLIAGREAA